MNGTYHALRQDKKTQRCFARKRAILQSQTDGAFRCVLLRHHDIGGFAEKLEKRAFLMNGETSIKLAAKSLVSFYLRTIF